MSRAYKLHKKKYLNIKKKKNNSKFKRKSKSTKLKFIQQKGKRISIKKNKAYRNRKRKITKRSLKGGGVLDNSIVSSVLNFTPLNGIMKVVNKVMGNKKTDHEDTNSSKSYTQNNNFDILENTIKANNHNITALKQLASSNSMDQMPKYIQHLRVINYE